MKFREFKEKTKNYPLFGSDMVDLLSPSPQALRNQIALLLVGLAGASTMYVSGRAGIYYATWAFSQNFSL